MKKGLWGWILVAPALIHLVAFGLAPIGYSALISSYKWNLLRGESRFVGATNYARIFQDADFLRSLSNSALYTALSVPLGAAVALAVAMLVVNKSKGIALFRTIFYLPSVCSQVATAMIWIYIFLPKKGMINATLGLFGLNSDTDFLSTPGLAMLALVFMSLWTLLGPRMILFVAGILNIPDSLYEAAALDGASRAKQFWRITLPMLAPTTLFVVLTSTISAMQVFTPVYMMTKGGPEGSTDVVGYHIYSAAWQRFQIGEASAMSMILFLVIFAVSMVSFRMMNRGVEAAI